MRNWRFDFDFGEILKMDDAIEDLDEEATQREELLKKSSVLTVLREPTSVNVYKVSKKAKNKNIFSLSSVFDSLN